MIARNATQSPYISLGFRDALKKQVKACVCTKTCTQSSDENGALSRPRRVLI